MNANDSMLVQVMSQVLIAVLVPVLVSGLTGLVAVGIQWVRSKLTKEQLAIVDQVLTAYALAADQYDLGGVVKRSGEEKKAWVVAQAQAALKKRGVNIDVGMLADMVEAIVLREVKKARWMEPETLIVTATEGAKIEAARALEEAKTTPVGSTVGSEELQAWE